MSGILAAKEDDIQKLLIAQSHIGAKNLNFQMKKYVFKRRIDGTHIININKTWEKISLAARIIVGIENPKDVTVVSGANFGQRAVLKFGAQVGANPIAGRYTPGTFTNQIQREYLEPRLLIVTDPAVDHQAVTEAAFGNIPVIAFCDTDAHVQYVDVVIPCNNKSVHSVGLVWWLLAREVLRLRGTLSRDTTWSVMPDLYFYRDPEEVSKNESEKAEVVASTQSWDAAVPAAVADDWAAAAPTAGFAGAGVDEWNNAPTTWGAAE